MCSSITFRYRIHSFSTALISKEEDKGKVEKEGKKEEMKVFGVY